MAVSPLVIYPAEGSNSFVSLVDADGYIEDTMEFESWQALSTDDRSRLLIATYERFMLTKSFIPPPDLTDSCLPKAQSLTAAHIVKYDLLNYEGAQQTRKEEFGSIRTEFFKNETLDRLPVDSYPDEAWACLMSYGAEALATGMGTIRHTR